MGSGGARRGEDEPFENLKGLFAHVKEGFEIFKEPFENLKGPFEHFKEPFEIFKGPFEFFKGAFENLKGPFLSPSYLPRILPVVVGKLSMK